MTQTPPSSLDPRAIVRSRGYVVLLVLAAVIGVLVSLLSWCYLELIYATQQWVFKDLPAALGFSAVPAWWPLPVLLVAGLVVAVAVVRLPGRGGHEPADGLASGGPTDPSHLPGILLASLASIGLGLVLGPEAPLIALGTGFGVIAVRRVRRDAPDQVVTLLAAAASFAAVSSLFGSPIVGAVIIIEAAGLGGATLPVILLPGLLAAGIGSLVFVGMGSLTGLSTKAYAISPLELPAYAAPQVGDFLWIAVLSALVAVAVFIVIEVGRAVQVQAHARPWLVYPGAAVVVALLAITFAALTDQPDLLILFSGQDALDPVISQAATLSVGTLVLILAFKAAAYGISLGAARGGPTFPALFLGVVAGVLASHLPGLSETPAVAALMGAATVTVLRLPLASVVLATVVSQAGLATAPLIIVGVVVAFVVVQFLDARREERRAPAPAPAL